MDPLASFCPNPNCAARGQTGKGNISVLSQKEKRYQCSVCGQTFVTRKGTPLYRCHTQEEEVVRVVILVQHGCPLSAIEAAFGFQKRTVRRWVAKVGVHCEAIHHHLVVTPRDLVQVQADEIRVKLQKCILWIAMAIALPTRLWLGAVLSPTRDTGLVRALFALVHLCALPLPLLVVVDGFRAYITVIQTTFRQAVKVHRFGRPRLLVWAELVIGQVVKHQQKRCLLEVGRHLVKGTEEQMEYLIATSQGAGVLNTAFIERLNATFRACLFSLVRRTRSLARQPASVHAGLYLVGTLYNFCRFHESLTTQEGTLRTPAMAAGITDHCWSVDELLCYRVPPERWQPSKRRGRKSKTLQTLIEKWAA
jgi:transposase-like protein